MLNAMLLRDVMCVLSVDVWFDARFLLFVSVVACWLLSTVAGRCVLLLVDGGCRLFADSLLVGWCLLFVVCCL